MQTVTRSELSVLANHLDREGRLVRWPGRGGMARAAARRYLASKFAPGVSYTEAEVNQTLDKWHSFGDAPALRRYLIESGDLNRTPDGRSYWLSESEEQA